MPNQYRQILLRIIISVLISVASWNFKTVALQCLPSTFFAIGQSESIAGRSASAFQQVWTQKAFSFCLVSHGLCWT